MLSQHLNQPTKAHLGMSRHVLKYLKGTKDHCVKFEKSYSTPHLNGFSDSDWGASEDRRSITGYCFRLNENGPLISWKCRKQQTVALSTCEAEYMALAAAIQEAKFLKQLLLDMVGYNTDKVLVNVDNQGAIALAKNPVHHQRSKHIDIKYHFIRSEIQNGHVIVNYVPTENNVADIFTKPVSGRRLNKLYHNIVSE